MARLGASGRKRILTPEHFVFYCAGLSGDDFRFDGNGDGPARYNIIHFKQSVPGQYRWVKVGEYYEGELRLNMSGKCTPTHIHFHRCTYSHTSTHCFVDNISEVKFKLLHPKPPESVCSLPCERGQAKRYVEGESCCWHCFNCTTYQVSETDPPSPPPFLFLQLK